MNLTPMMDLTFLLLITFIITFPLVESGIPVKLPEGKAKPYDASMKSAVVSVDAAGRIFLENDPVTIEELSVRLGMLKSGEPDLKLIIRGDVESSYGSVVEIAKTAHQLGINGMSLSTRDR